MQKSAFLSVSIPEKFSTLREQQKRYGLLKSKSYFEECSISVESEAERNVYIHVCVYAKLNVYRNIIKYDIRNFIFCKKALQIHEREWRFCM